MWDFPELASGWGLTSRGLTNCNRITTTEIWGRLLVYTTSVFLKTTSTDFMVIFMGKLLMLMPMFEWYKA
jgi:hypothetical protein